MRRTILVSLTIAALISGPALALPALRDVPAIDDALLDLGIADRIRKECPDINARMFKAVAYAYNLESQARAMGYSKAEIDSYIKSPAEKARMKARGADFFKARGVDTSDPQSYCRLGRTEIQKKSRIGSLLRAK